MLMRCHDEHRLIYDDSDMTYFGMTDLDIDDQLRRDAFYQSDAFYKSGTFYQSDAFYKSDDFYQSDAFL